MKGDRLSFCEQCIHEGKGRAMSEAEARLHQDHNPNHKIVTAEITDEN